MFTIYEGHTDNVFALCWSSDGRTLASAGRDRTIQIWDVITGTRRLIYEQHPPIFSLSAGRQMGVILPPAIPMEPSMSGRPTLA